MLRVRGGYGAGAAGAGPRAARDGWFTGSVPPGDVYKRPALWPDLARVHVSRTPRVSYCRLETRREAVGGWRDGGGGGGWRQGVVRDGDSGYVYIMHIYVTTVMN